MRRGSRIASSYPQVNINYMYLIFVIVGHELLDPVCLLCYPLAVT